MITAKEANCITKGSKAHFVSNLMKCIDLRVKDAASAGKYSYTCKISNLMGANADIEDFNLLLKEMIKLGYSLDVVDDEITFSWKKTN